VVGQGEVEPGLDEGIRLLHSGDKARFILPPHLAYGLIGDENKIPARSVIVYDLTVLSVDD
jgi:FKBP-type peptidyl-prolyl cis-trans isomerase